MEDAVSEAEDKGREAVDAVREVSDHFVEAIDESIKRGPTRRWRSSPAWHSCSGRLGAGDFGAPR